MASLVDSPDLSHLGTDFASADFPSHQFNYLGWRMLAPVEEGGVMVRKVLKVVFNVLVFFLHFF